MMATIYMDDEPYLWHNGFRDYGMSVGRYLQSDRHGGRGEHVSICRGESGFFSRPDRVTSLFYFWRLRDRGLGWL